ncbi:MAG: hypothetical protein J7L22_09940 [Candidatus Marinimicrobia bacterium]|nr:hypothetical protein [Candidatus Neomarinimicrobiota bacterium]
MKRILVLFSVLFLFACSANKKTAEIGKINFQVSDFAEARSQARDTGKLLLAYFYTDW